MQTWLQKHTTKGFKPLLWTRPLHAVCFSKIEVKHLTAYEDPDGLQIQIYKDCQFFTTDTKKLPDEEKDEIMEDFAAEKCIESFPAYATLFLQYFGYCYEGDRGDETLERQNV